ncbi:MAG: ATP-binding cassette domain-containing protein [Lachnospiraceae bacterium]|nr:ATP-binding cassette domain-containing protein [Lachnospiraceae bacterium]
MALISTENLSKRYGKDEVEVMALDKVSLFIEEGEILSVMGTSGSGKSTLLNLSGFRLKKMGFIFLSCNLY